MGYIINVKYYFTRPTWKVLVIILISFGVVPLKALAVGGPAITIYCADVYPCPGSPVVFTSIVNNASSNLAYQWSVNGTNMGTNSAIFTVLNSISNPIKPTDVIQCTVTDLADNTTGISNKLNNINVVVQQPLMFQIFSQTTLPVCSGTEVEFGTQYSNLSENHVNNLNGVWRVNGVIVHTGLTFISTTLKDGDVVTCTGTFYLKCAPPTDVESNSIKVSILNSAPPTIAIAPVNGIGCINSVLTFKATLNNAGIYNTYQWFVNGNNAGTNSNTFSSSALQTGDKVSCQVTANTNCAVYKVESAPVDITIIPQSANSVVINSDAVNNFIVANQTVMFTAKASYTGNVDYQWKVNGTNAGTDSNVFTDNTLTIGDVVTCTVTSADACVVPATAISNAILILMHVPLKIPNVFTPNNDNINDSWEIKALLIYPACTVKVFNRYGALIFYSNGYTNAWKGTQNGRPLPPGVYYYLINLNNGTAPIAGPVTIVR